MNDRKRLAEYMNNGYNLDFAAKIEPDGNPYFTSEYIRFGQGFVTCLNVFDLPKSNMQDFWISPLTQNEDTFTVIDFGTEEKSETIDSLKKDIRDVKSSYKSNGEEISQENLRERYRQQRKALDKIMHGGEFLKTLNIRIFVYALTYDNLMKKVQHIISTLSGQNIKVGINADELPFDYKSIFLPISEQESLPNRPIPFRLTSDNLAGGYFFNHIMLDDPHGEFIGHTSTAGAVNFDMWHHDETRNSSHMIVLGNSGTGKSTLLKMLTEGNFVRNNIIRNFDVVGEYQDLTKNMGGVVISLDGSEGSINPMQIFPTVTSIDGKQIDVVGSFFAHVNKLKNQFHFMDSNLDDSSLNLLQTLIKKFYVQQKLWVDDARNHLSEVSIFLPNDEYPLMHDFLTFLHQAKEGAIQQNDSSENVERINRLTLAAENMVDNYQDVFDRITNIREFEQEQVVTFDLSGLKTLGDNVFNAQVYSMLALTTSHAVKNGRTQLRKYESGEIDEKSIRHYIINIDECQNIINPRFPFGVQYVAKLEEEMRKNFCAVALATPSIETILPSKSVNSDSNYERDMAKLFSNTQYRFFFQLDDSSLSRLSNVMGNSMTMAELSSIPNLKKKQCMLNLSYRRNIPFNVYARSEQLARYHGGI